jgi:hypothetical protein
MASIRFVPFVLDGANLGCSTRGSHPFTKSDFASSVKVQPLRVTSTVFGAASRGYSSSMRSEMVRDRWSDWSAIMRAPVTISVTSIRDLGRDLVHSGALNIQALGHKASRVEDSRHRQSTLPSLRAAECQAATLATTRQAGQMSRT